LTTGQYVVTLLLSTIGQQGVNAMYAPATVGYDSRKPGELPWGPVLRGASVVGGLVGAALVFVVGGLMAVLSGCNPSYGATTMFCPGHEDLATGLELAALIPGIVAPLAGGIASCVRSHPGWLAGGYAIGLIMLAILYILAGGQESLLS
jgi:hypothetical protein